MVERVDRMDREEPVGLSVLSVPLPVTIVHHLHDSVVEIVQVLRGSSQRQAEEREKSFFANATKNHKDS